MGNKMGLFGNLQFLNNFRLKTHFWRLKADKMQGLGDNQPGCRTSPILKIIAITASTAAIVELALSQLVIKITRLSTAETTGIFLFAFIIFSLVTLFAVTRMKDSPWAKLFAIVMNFITAFAATWYLWLLFSDEVFFRNLYYVLNRQTQDYELLSIGARLYASIPLALIIGGAAVYYLCGIGILAVILASVFGSGFKGKKL